MTSELASDVIPATPPITFLCPTTGISGGPLAKRGDARVEEEHLFAATTVSAALFGAGEIEELARDTFFGGQDDAVFGEDAEDGACVGDGLHRILDCEGDRRAQRG